VPAFSGYPAAVTPGAVDPAKLSRRTFLRVAAALGATSLVAPRARAAGGCLEEIGPLQAADANGLMLPAGFSSRVVATTAQTVAGTSHTWHGAPDGGATFAKPDGGWIYVSNSEIALAGGVGAISFDPSGAIVGAYSILSGTSVNCAGGPTPWNTWLSCEEVPQGRVFECDPYTPGSNGVARPALGTFQHEAAAVAHNAQRIFLTEDRADGLFYRFTPASYPSLAAGTLEAAQILDPNAQGPIQPGQVRPVAWNVVPNPNPTGSQTQTRYQVPATTFNGGEGCWYRGALVSFATKGNNRIWQLDPVANTIRILYDLATASNPILSGVDNTYTTPCGDVLVAEDGGNLEIVALSPTGAATPVVRLVGVAGTEITGPALSPDGSRLYFSSQRNPGRTFEVSGPFAQAQSVPSLGSGAWSLLLIGALGASALRAFRGARETSDTGRATRDPG
jgi:secreted PhoX family phosphatase